MHLIAKLLRLDRPKKVVNVGAKQSFGHQAINQTLSLTTTR